MLRSFMLGYECGVNLVSGNFDFFRISNISFQLDQLFVGMDVFIMEIEGGEGGAGIMVGDEAIELLPLEVNPSSQPVGTWTKILNTYSWKWGLCGIACTLVPFGLGVLTGGFTTVKIFCGL